ncbi:MAG: CRISPR-associated protein Cas4 [Coriobacteriia bacterium]|nr:CRISPR-associated protein Cas4 [Coriobacteriia bacterium]
MTDLADDYLALSGVQHFAFCPRQWALVHVEGQWAENERTLDGKQMHERCHDGHLKERRGDVIVVRGLSVVSHTLRLKGLCDVVEFHRNDDGVALQGEQGRYVAVPVEYKRGKQKIGDEDRAQVCCQAMALEEMLCCSIPEGYLYYGAEHHRERVEINGQLREYVVGLVESMRDCMNRSYTPTAHKHPGCYSCSLREVCLPKMSDSPSAQAYLDKMLKGMQQ